MSSWHWTQIPGRLPEVLLPSELSHWPYRQLSSPGFKQKSQLWTLWSWLTFSKPQLWQNPVVFIIKTFGWYQIAGMPLLYITFLGRCWGHRGKWSRVIAFFWSSREQRLSTYLFNQWSECKDPLVSCLRLALTPHVLPAYLCCRLYPGANTACFTPLESEPFPV